MIDRKLPPRLSGLFRASCLLDLALTSLVFLSTLLSIPRKEFDPRYVFSIWSFFSVPLNVLGFYLFTSSKESLSESLFIIICFRLACCSGFSISTFFDLVKINWLATESDELAPKLKLHFVIFALLVFATSANFSLYRGLKQKYMDLAEPSGGSAAEEQITLSKL